MTEDAQLLDRYAHEHSEASFAELTRRHVDLVYSAALRLVHGNVHSAQDVTQQVFTEAARNAKRLARHPALVGWFYTTTRLISLRQNRTEQRRRTREQEAYTMNQLLHDERPPTDWGQLGPVLEDAMHELDDKDRHALLLRFFQNKSLGEVGAALNLSDNAARMRVERALEKLRGKLARRGLTTTAAALAALMVANAVQAAPGGFVATLAGSALAASAAPATTLLAATKAITMTILQKTILATALAAAVGTGIYAARHTAELRAQLELTRQEQAPLAAQVRQLEAERNQASERLAVLVEENARLKSGRSEAELLKLRGEVGALRQTAVSNGSKAAQPTGGLARMLSDPAMKEYMRKAMMDKMGSLYADLIKELKLTPQQTDQFLELLSDSASKTLAQLTGASPGPAQSAGEAVQDITGQLRALLGDAGCVRLKEFSEEMPARATLTLLNTQLGSTPLGEEEAANLIRVIKAEPSDLTQGIVGSPDKAFLGSQADIDNFLQRVSQSNQRILQQAGSFLSPGQVTALDAVLAKATETRKLQGAAFFQKQ